MRRIVRRSVVAAAAVLGVVALTAGEAAAGGWTWIELDRGAYARGETVSSSVRFWSLRPRYDYGGPADGPYRLYLLREDAWIDPPGLPAFAVPLADVGISDPEGDGEPPYRARFSFTVPDVEVGRYSLGICDVPCTRTLGDIGTGRLFVAETPAEARLVERVDRLESSLGRRLRARSSSLRDRIRVDERLVQEETASLRDRIASLEERLEAAIARAERPSEVTLPQPIVGDLPAILIAAALLALAGGVALRRRPRPPRTPPLPRAESAVGPDQQPEDGDGDHRAHEVDPVALGDPIEQRIHVS